MKCLTATIIWASTLYYTAGCLAASIETDRIERSTPRSLRGWHHQTTTYGLDLPNYTPPYTSKKEFENFLTDLEHHILEQELAVGGNIYWEWPYGHFGYKDINGIEIAIFEHEDALLPLNLGETKAIPPLLRKWMEAFAEGADVPSIHLLQVTWKNTDDSISFGSIYMPENKRSEPVANIFS